MQTRRPSRPAERSGLPEHLELGLFEAEVRTTLDGALSTDGPRVLAALASTDELLSIAEHIKSAEPEKYGGVRVWKTGQTQISFEERPLPD